MTTYFTEPGAEVVYSIGKSHAHFYVQRRYATLFVISFLRVIICMEVSFYGQKHVL